MLDGAIIVPLQALLWGLLFELAALIWIIDRALLIVAYFIPAAQSWGEVAAIWFDVLAAIAFILGGGNLLKIHLRKVSDRAAGWAYSAICLVAFLGTLIVGLGKVGVSPNEQFPAHSWSGSYRETGSPFWFFYEYGFKPLTATMFGSARILAMFFCWRASMKPKKASLPSVTANSTVCPAVSAIAFTPAAD